LASISYVRVALVVLRAFADVAIGDIGAVAVAADARVAERWLLAFPGAFGAVPDGEIDHVGHASGELVAGVAVQVRAPWRSCTMTPPPTWRRSTGWLPTESYSYSGPSWEWQL
jgi:hypothetical protein